MSFGQCTCHVHFYNCIFQIQTQNPIHLTFISVFCQNPPCRKFGFYCHFGHLSWFWRTVVDIFRVCTHKFDCRSFVGKIWDKLPLRKQIYHEALSVCQQMNIGSRKKKYKFTWQFFPTQQISSNDCTKSWPVDCCVWKYKMIASVDRLQPLVSKHIQMFEERVLRLASERHTPLWSSIFARILTKSRILKQWTNSIVHWHKNKQPVGTKNDLIQTKDDFCSSNSWAVIFFLHSQTKFKQHLRTNTTVHIQASHFQLNQAKFSWKANLLAAVSQNIEVYVHIGNRNPPEVECVELCTGIPGSAAPRGGVASPAAADALLAAGRRASARGLRQQQSLELSLNVGQHGLPKVEFVECGRHCLQQSRIRFWAKQKQVLRGRCDSCTVICSGAQCSLLWAVAAARISCPPRIDFSVLNSGTRTAGRETNTTTVRSVLTLKLNQSVGTTTRERRARSFRQKVLRAFSWIAVGLVVQCMFTDRLSIVSIGKLSQWKVNLIPKWARKSQRPFVITKPTWRTQTHLAVEMALFNLWSSWSLQRFWKLQIYWVHDSLITTSTGSDPRLFHTTWQFPFPTLVRLCHCPRKISLEHSFTIPSFQWWKVVL